MCMTHRIAILLLIEFQVLLIIESDRYDVGLRLIKEDKGIVGLRCNAHGMQTFQFHIN